MGYNGKHSGAEVDTAIYSMGMAPDFVVKGAGDTPYAKNDFVTYNGKMYRLTADSFSGAWDATKWVLTSGVGEIRNLRNANEGSEHVQLHFAVNKGSGVVSGLSVVIRFGAGSSQSTLTKTLDASGNCDFYVPYGDSYRIEPSALQGYRILKSAYYTAAKASRQLNINYVLIEDGYFIIDTDKNITPFSEWNTDNNNKAAFVLCGSSAQAIIFPKTLSISSAAFQAEYVDCTEVTDRGDATYANADFAGKSQNSAWVHWATTPVEGSEPLESPLQKYNRLQSKSYTVDDYLPAVRGCYNKTVEFDNRTLHGYLPAMGELRYLCDNKTQLTTVMSTIGGSNFPNLASGGWWSCSEYGNDDCWILNGGTTDTGNKYGSYQLFALYDLSEINL